MFLTEQVAVLGPGQSGILTRVMHELPEKPVDLTGSACFIHRVRREPDRSHLSICLEIQPARLSPGSPV